MTTPYNISKGIKIILTESVVNNCCRDFGSCTYNRKQHRSIRLKRGAAVLTYTASFYFYVTCILLYVILIYGQSIIVQSRNVLYICVHVLATKRICSM